MLTEVQNRLNVLVVDDEPGLHDVTRLVLKRMHFDERPVNIMSAYSAQEARKLFKDNPEIAVALIDVVMETDQAGLELIKDMRKTYGMDLTRIILRTGNPGLAPEREVIQHFEIDDYRDKTELTSNRLYTSVYTALRAYQTLVTLEQTALGLEEIIKSVEAPYDPENFIEFLNPLITQLTQIAGVTKGVIGIENLIATAGGSAEPKVVFGKGQFESWTNQKLADVATSEVLEAVKSAFHGDTVSVSDQGVLISLYSPQNDQFVLWIPTIGKPQPHVLRLLKILTEKFRLNIENAKLHEEILEAQRTALSKLCEAVEMRSKETGQHIYRMAKYSKLLAKLSGLSHNTVQLIEAAAPLHDIGKVAIPDSILKKAGPLDAEEMLVMQSHAQSGFDLLIGSTSEMLKLGAEIAQTHHERWDGSGYPRKLKGEQIPLAGRIVALADVFDALMSKRVYKEAFSFEKTIEIIQENSGRFFDPNLVDLLVKNGEQFYEIFEKNPDLA